MLKIQFRFFLFVILALLVHSATASQTNTSEDRKAVQNIYVDWCDAIGKAKGDPNVMVKFYAPDAVLLPTFYPKILLNRDNGLDKYFKVFTSQPNIECHPDALTTRLYGNIALNAGFYHFTYTEKDGKTKTVYARFTFVYKLDDKKWLIIEHHSSVRPMKKTDKQPE